MTGVPAQLSVTADVTGEVCLLAAHGRLDSRTYLHLRDSVVKAAIDEPAAVVVDVDALRVPAESAWSVFASARWQVSTWPDVPVVLVCTDPVTRRVIARNGITRYVPVHPDLDTALCDIGNPQTSYRRRASATLPATVSSLRDARRAVSRWLTAWSRDELVPTAKIVVDALVHNVLCHTDSAPTVTLENVGSKVTIVVRDTSSAVPVRREAAGGVAPLSGLAVVTALTQSWGSMATQSGKAVWAIIAESTI